MTQAYGNDRRHWVYKVYEDLKKARQALVTNEKEVEKHENEVKELKDKHNKEIEVLRGQLEKMKGLVDKKIE